MLYSGSINDATKMTPQTFVMVGKSGCGKGTQTEKIKEYLKQHDGNRAAIHVETGKLFREFVSGEKHTQKLAKEIADVGGLQPEFLTVSIWSKFLVDNMTSDCHLIFDGTPRKFDEAHVLDTAFSFYKREKPFVIFMDAENDVVIPRLLARGRSDDHEDAIKTRLQWFNDQVTKVVDYYRTSPDYRFIRVDSSQSIDRVFHDILSATGLEA
jgi:adenylate kinase